MTKDLYSIYRYFSHHMRNSTAMIATSVTLLSYESGENLQENPLIHEVVRASFLLDLFDAGMGICFEDKATLYPSHLERYEMVPSIKHFLDQCDYIVQEKNINVEILVDNPSKLSANVHDLRTMTNIVLYEILLQTVGKLTFEISKNSLTITSEGFEQIPTVWEEFHPIFATRGLLFDCKKNVCILEYRI